MSLLRRGSLCCLSFAVGMSVLAPSVLAPSVARAQEAVDTTGLSGDEEARMRFELGRRYYDTGRFADAAREFSEAHRLSGRTELLYNLFLAYRDAGDDLHAAETLRAYVPSLEAGERRTQLEARLRVLEARLAGGSAPDPIGAQTDTPPPVDPVPDTTTDTTRPDETSRSSGGGLGVIPWAIVGVGGALIVASVITGVLALDARSTLERMCSADGACPPGYEGTLSGGQGLAIVTDVLWITGAVAVTTGVVLAIVDLTSSSGSSERASVGGACTSDGCFVAAGGRF